MKKDNMDIIEIFTEVETIKEHKGYFYSVEEAVIIVMLGSLCGLRNISQIHQWATSKQVSEFLKEEFGIEKIPCYYWLISLLKLVKPESLNRCFMKWVESLLPKNTENLTISLDGKTICSTAKMDSYKNPLHIVSAQISELGITFAQKSVDGKSNEIPSVQELLKHLKIDGCIIVADALNCQKETAKIIVEEKADYLLCVKGNHRNLKRDIKDYIQDKTFQKTMNKKTKVEKNRGRIEKRTAFTTDNINWLDNKKEWSKIKCIGAIHSETESKKGKTNKWRYYISSRNLTAEELLHHARMEWRVETMHWLLDVHFEEDFCRIEDKKVQENLNMFRKVAINLIKQYKEKTDSKRPISKIMFDCMLDNLNILKVIANK